MIRIGDERVRWSVVSEVSAGDGLIILDAVKGFFDFIELHLFSQPPPRVSFDWNPVEAEAGGSAGGVIRYRSSTRF